MIEFEKLIHNQKPVYKEGGRIIFKKEMLELSCTQQFLSIGFHSIEDVRSRCLRLEIHCMRQKHPPKQI